MANESRVKKSLLNARINTICYFASLFVAFFTRKILLDNLGAEFLGLSGTLYSLLGFLNLAELGVGTAIGYVLYKPIFNNDKLKINEIISVLGYIYRVIGFFILGAGILLSLFLPFIFPDTSFPGYVIYIGFYAYLAASLLGYFVNYKMNLLAADQKNYIITGYFQLTLNCKIILQMILAFLTHSVIYFLFLELITGIVNSIIITKKVRKTYPWLEADVHEGKKLFKKYPEIGRYVKQLFVHKIGGFTQLQLTPFLIYSFVSLPLVAIYNNYTIVTQRISGLISGMLDNSMSAGVGNLISEGNHEKIYKTFRELLAFRFFAIGMVASCLYYLINPFIAVWLGGEYVLTNTIIILVIAQFVLTSLRGTTDQFLFGYGLFYDVWAPVAESLIFVSVSMICGTIWGLAGVLIGPLVSLFIIVHIWKPYFLYSKGLKLPYRKYIFLVFFYLLLFTISFMLGSLPITPIQKNLNINTEWMNWILLSVIVSFIYAIVFALFFYLFSTDFRSICRTLIKRFYNRA